MIEEWTTCLCNVCEETESYEGYCTNTDCPIHHLQQLIEQLNHHAVMRRESRTTQEIREACEDDAVYILLGIEQQKLVDYFKWKGLL